MTDIEIRRATSADCAALAGLLGQLGYPASAGELPARLDRFAAQPHAAVLVACREGDVVGVATVHVITPLHQTKDVAWLTALAIDEGARRQKVGRALVRAVEAFAREAGCDRLSVTTHVRRSDAHAFYESIGFELTGRRYGKALHG